MYIHVQHLRADSKLEDQVRYMHVKVETMILLILGAWNGVRLCK